MATVAGSRKTDMAERTRLEVPAGEVVPGDVIRDEGRFRRIERVEPKVVELSLVWFFDPADGVSDRLRVPAHISVSVWRVSNNG